MTARTFYITDTGLVDHPPIDSVEIDAPDCFLERPGPYLVKLEDNLLFDDDDDDRKPITIRLPGFTVQVIVGNLDYDGEYSARRLTVFVEQKP